MISLFFYAFVQNYATGSVWKNPKTSIFYSAHHELSIDMKNITIALLEPNFVKEAKKKGLFYSIFQIYGTRSGRKWLKMAKFNSAHQEQFIEGCNIAVLRLEAKLQNYTQKGAILRVFPELRDRK